MKLLSSAVMKHLLGIDIIFSIYLIIMDYGSEQMSVNNSEGMFWDVYDPQNHTHLACFVPKALMENDQSSTSGIDMNSGGFSTLVWSNLRRSLQSMVQKLDNLQNKLRNRARILDAASIPSGPYHNPPVLEGKTVIVHLFEWKWKDIASECEQFLGPNGFAAVQISQPAEHSILWEPSWNKEVKRPWYERYRPVSYKLITRSGTEEELEDMVNRCNTVGIRIYVDVVLNHMCHHRDVQQSTGGSTFNPGIPRYDGVPYYPENFNSREKCGSRSGSIENFQDVKQLRNCRLLGLNDLDQSKEYVQEKMVEFLNHLIDLGVAGFRVDAAKHMWPKDLEQVYSKMKDLNPKYFPLGQRPFIYQEVTDMGLDPISATEYVSLGRVTEFHYGVYIGDVLRKRSEKTLADLKTFGESWGQLPSYHALVFIDNHDSQRGHGVGELHDVLTFFEPRLYKTAVAFMLAWPYGIARVMSSYRWVRNRDESMKDKNDWWGPPHDENFNILDVDIESDSQCGGDWVCEHRWREIARMVSFRNVAGELPVLNWWDNGCHQIAFSRGNAAFIAINNEEKDELNQNLQTGLPEGVYCDIISSTVMGTECSGLILHVDSQGMARINIAADLDIPIVATHIKARIS